MHKKGSRSVAPPSQFSTDRNASFNTNSRRSRKRRRRDRRRRPGKRRCVQCHGPLCNLSSICTYCLSRNVWQASSRLHGTSRSAGNITTATTNITDVVAPVDEVENPLDNVKKKFTSSNTGTSQLPDISAPPRPLPVASPCPSTVKFSPNPCATTVNRFQFSNSLSTVPESTKNCHKTVNHEKRTNDCSRERVVKDEPLYSSTKDCVTTNTDAMHVSQREKPLPRCSACSSLFEPGPWQASSTLCASCFFDAPIPSSPVNFVSAPASPSPVPKYIEQNVAPSTDNSSSIVCPSKKIKLGVGMSNASHISLDETVDSLSSLDYPAPLDNGLDGKVSRVSPTDTIPRREDTVNQYDFTTVTSTSTIRLCRNCNSTFGTEPWEVNNSLCGTCFYEAPLIRVKQSHEDNSIHLMDDERLTRFARRRSHTAPLGDDESLAHYVKRVGKQLGDNESFLHYSRRKKCKIGGNC